AANLPAPGPRRRFAAVADVLEHVAAGLLAPPALLGAFLHVLVLGKGLAGLAAAATGLGAGLADQVAERPLARHDARRRAAVGGAVLTGPQGRKVLLLALGEQVPAVSRAHVAGALTVAARLRALREVLRAPVVVGPGRPGQHQGRREQGSRRGTNI